MIETKNDFIVFCNKTKDKLDESFESFEIIYQYIDDLIKDRPDSSELIYKIYEQLKGTYINCNYSEFKSAMEDHHVPYSGKRIEWLETKYHLYYFIYKYSESELKIKSFLKWTESRFIIKKIDPKWLAHQLGKIRSQGSKYHDIIDDLNDADPLKKVVKLLQ